MLLKTETYKHQSSIAEYCRNGKAIEIEGVNPERLPQYRRLVFNVVKNALQTTYPISTKYIKEDFWQEMMYNFFSTHKCQDPQVWRMPHEFYAFCKEQNYSKKYELPYLNDLLHFEWLEVELYMMEDISYPVFKNKNPGLKDRIAVNPEHQIIKLGYPVHLFNPLEAVNRKGEFYVLLFRERDTGKIQFVNISVLFTFLIENIVSTEKSLEDILNDILYIFAINDIELLQKEIFKFLNDLKNKGFVLGKLIE